MTARVPTSSPPAPGLLRRLSYWLEPRWRDPGWLAFALNRLTGHILVLYLILHFVILSQLLDGPSGWDRLLGVFGSRPLLVADTLLMAAVVFHGLNVGFTFEAILVAADAFKRAKTTDPKTLADAIRQTNITEKMTLGGPIKFNPKGQVEGIGSACVQNLKLVPTVVLPRAAATAKPVFPVPGYKKV